MEIHGDPQRNNATYGRLNGIQKYNGLKQANLNMDRLKSAYRYSPIDGRKQVLHIMHPGVFFAHDRTHAW